MGNGIEVAVFPVAGMGTRFLPVTKSSPKEMLAIIDKPLIQYAVEEAIAAGIKEWVFVTHSSKRALEDYFDTNYELECRLEAASKLKQLSLVRDIIPADVKISYVRQREPRGLGDAILCAEHVVAKRPFAVLLADDLLSATIPCLTAMVDAYQQTGASQIAVQSKAEQELHQYGVVRLDQETSRRITAVVEKPVLGSAPSNLAILGRYILPPSIFAALQQTPIGVGGELQLTDAIAAVLEQDRVHAHHFKGQRFDCGSVHGFVEATLHFARERTECADLFAVGEAVVR